MCSECRCSFALQIFQKKKIENAGGDLIPLSHSTSSLAEGSGKEWVNTVIDKSEKVRVSVLACCCS